MVQGRRGRLLAVVALLMLAAACGGAKPAQTTSTPVPTGVPSPTTTAPAPAPAAAEPPVAAGRDALVAVAVATVWNEPGQARPVDQPSVTNPVDIRRWTSTMTNDDKLWLVDRLATQALYGERVGVREIRDGWARVVVTGQPSSQDPAGYPGWMPAAQLVPAAAAAGGRTAVVVRPTVGLHDVADPSHVLVELSYNTRLPVLATTAERVTVATPTGGRAFLAPGDVEVQPPGPQPTSSADVVQSAKLFSGLPYLWAGTSAAGFDCSGFTAAVYGAHGIVLPRDADDQALAGKPVDAGRLQPGDLLFYAGNGGKGAIYHVSMYVGGGMMIQSPATGRTVETVPVDTPSMVKQFWGARRYLPA
jgi:cell wall-associated NlpC family hydrolase